MAGVFTRRYVTVTVKDGAGTPLTRTVGPGPGDFTIDGLEAGNYEAVKVLDRGQFYELVAGDDKEVTLGGSIYVDGDQTGASVIDAILKSGDWASATTTDPGGVVWAFTLVITESRAGVTNTYTCNKCRAVAGWAEAVDGNKIPLTFTCYGGVTRS